MPPLHLARGNAPTPAASILKLLHDVEAALETDQWQMRAHTASHSGASLNGGTPVLNSGKQPDQRSAPGIHARGQLLAAARANWRAAGPCRWSQDDAPDTSRGSGACPAGTAPPRSAGRPGRPAGRALDLDGWTDTPATDKGSTRAAACPQHARHGRAVGVASWRGALSSRPGRTGRLDRARGRLRVMLTVTCRGYTAGGTHQSHRT